MSQCLLYATFKMENEKTELYLLVILIKLAIFALVKIIKSIHSAHKGYKNQLKKKYDARAQNVQKSLTEVVVHQAQAKTEEKDDHQKKLATVIFHNPADLRNSATTTHSPDLKH